MNLAPKRKVRPTIRHLRTELRVLVSRMKPLIRIRQLRVRVPKPSWQARTEPSTLRTETESTGHKV